jgi:adenylosuccinate synthase
MCRDGACNASHGIIFSEKKFFFHQIPCGCLHNRDAKLIIGAAAQIDINHLKHEIDILKEQDRWLDSKGNVRLMIDRHAVIVDALDKVAENGGRMPDCGDVYFHPCDCKKNMELGNTCIGCSSLPEDSAWRKLGSTTFGCGANYIRKIARGTKMALLSGQPLDLVKYFRDKCPEDATNDEISEKILEIVNSGPITDWASAVDVVPIRYAKEDEFLQQFLGDTVEIKNRMIDNNQNIMLEGTQGSVLSIHHGVPFKTTSRDTNCSAWCADAGISALAVRDVYGVTRTFPIRVAGDSGPLGAEVTWDEITKFAESPTPIIEQTSATKRVRRCFLLDEKILRRSLDLNRPTKLMLSFVDYLHYSDYGKSSWDNLSQKTRDWITTLESKMGIFFNYLSTGPAPEHTVIRKSPGELLGHIQAHCPKDEC